MPAPHRSSAIATAASGAAGATPHRGHAPATLVAGPTDAPVGAPVKGGA
jgi:hypothetical protein